MRYEKFKETVLCRIKEFLPEEYQSDSFEYRKTEVVNGTEEMLAVVPSDNGIVLSLCMRNFYEKYMQFQDIALVLECMANSIVKLNESKKNYTKSNLRNNVVIQLVNAKQNEKMLQSIPHRRILDLAMIYKAVTLVEDGMNWMLLNNEMIKELSVTEEELYRWAYKNTSRQFHFSINPMAMQIRKDISKIIEDGNMDLYQIRDLLELLPEHFPEARDDTWTIHTKEGINASSILLYKSLLDYIAERVEDDFYIVPLSVNEMVAVSVRTGVLDELEKSLLEVNMGVTEPESRLTNSIYLYDKDKEKLRIVSKNENSRIDKNVFYIKL